MPLVFGILVIIVVFVCAIDNNNESARVRGNTAWDLRKTNCKLECKLYRNLIYEQSISLQDAIPRVAEELMQKGFVPCLDLDLLKNMVELYTVPPPSAKDGNFLTASYGYDHFDSFAVNNRKKILEVKNLPINDDTVYADFPKNQYEYMWELDLASHAVCCHKIGTWITYPEYGSVQIIGYNDRLTSYCCKDVHGKICWVPVKSKLIRR